MIYSITKSICFVWSAPNNPEIDEETIGDFKIELEYNTDVPIKINEEIYLVDDFYANHDEEIFDIDKFLIISSISRFVQIFEHDRKTISITQFKAIAQPETVYINYDNYINKYRDKNGIVKVPETLEGWLKVKKELEEDKKE